MRPPSSRPDMWPDGLEPGYRRESDVPGTLDLDDESSPMSGVTINLGAGETAVVGYGLLLSRDTIDKTLGRIYEGPFASCHIDGWRRSWDVSMPNAAFYYEEEGARVYPEQILYLNVRRDPDTLMNCTVFVLREDELAVMHGREWIYNGLVATADLRGVRLEGGDALMYVGKAEHRVRSATSPHDVAVRKSYLRMLDRVLDSVDPAIRAEYRQTTDPMPEHLVIDDSLDPDRPNSWEAAGHSFRPELP